VGDLTNKRKIAREVVRIHRSLKRRLGPDRVCDTSDPRLKKGRVGAQLNSGVSLERPPQDACETFYVLSQTSSVSTRREDD